jgi:hypothetical protein
LKGPTLSKALFTAGRYKEHREENNLLYERMVAASLGKVLCIFIDPTANKFQRKFLNNIL